MEISFTPDLEAKLTRIAAERGRESQALVVEAVERMVNYDEWFLQAVTQGLKEAERGELVDHADVLKMIDQRHPR